MADFLEERLIETVRYGASWKDDYAVDNSRTSGGQEYPRLIHPFPVREFDVSYLLAKPDLYAQLMAIYHRAHGTFAAFRVRCFDEWSSNGDIVPPTAFDQPMGLVSAGVYELRKYYGLDKPAGATGYPHRKIKKPVAGTVLVGIGATAIRSADWSVGVTTGLVTLAADLTRGVTSISKAAQAVLDVGAGHPFVTGMSLQVSGVAGMTEINGVRALVTGTGASTVTLAINSTAFSAYSSGGVVHTRPQAGESVTAGFQFDFPAAFIMPLVVGQDYPNHRMMDSVRLRERLNP